MHIICQKLMCYTHLESGNGRVVREFIRQLALKNGYELNIKNISANDMLEASIESVVDTSFLQELIKKCLKKK